MKTDRLKHLRRNLIGITIGAAVGLAGNGAMLVKQYRLISAVKEMCAKSLPLTARASDEAPITHLEGDVASLQFHTIIIATIFCFALYSLWSLSRFSAERQTPQPNV